MKRDVKEGLVLTKRQAPESDMKALEQLLEDQYLKRRRKTEHKTKNSFSPSSVGYGSGNCPRRWVLSFRGADFADMADALGIATMWNGTDSHERIQSLFEEAGILVEKEVEIKMKSPPVRGFVDVMIRWGEEIMPGEIKTTSEEAFAFRKAHMKPTPYHLLQLLLYLKATGKTKGFLFYENRNTNKFLVIEISLEGKNVELLDYALDWMREVHKAYKDGKLPKQAYQKRNKFCKECPVFTTCWGEPTFDLEIPKLEVKEKIEELR